MLSMIFIMIPKLSFADTVWEFECIEDYQTFTAPHSANYVIEVWGAQGHKRSRISSSNIGRGGYTKGTIFLNSGETIYVYVGQHGIHAPYLGSTDGAWNGGGGAWNQGHGGGGATDIRTVSGGWDSNEGLHSRILIAGGGGGACDSKGGHGGGAYGTDGEDDRDVSGDRADGGEGGSQTSGDDGSFGKGGDSDSSWGCAGGGGWYGGGAGERNDCAYGAGGGGSGYVDTTRFTDYTMSTGVRYGDGYCTITLGNCNPTVTNNTVNNQRISSVSGYTNVTVSGTVNDVNTGDTLKIYYRVDGSEGNVGTQLGNDIIADGTNQAFTESINLSTYGEGSHTLYLWSEDSEGGKSEETSTTFVVDKSLPTVNSPGVRTLNTNQIRITPNASDTSGLAGAPYIYNRNGTDITSWVSTSPYTDTGLTPNTQYTYKYRAKDALEISGYSGSVSKYTKAFNPSNVVVTNKTKETLSINITTASGQGQAPQYYLKLKQKGAGLSGTDRALSSWSTATTRTLTGLTENTEYELWLYTRNGDNVSNTPYLAIPSLKTNASPTINNTTENYQSISGNTGYTEINVTGSKRH